jgi:hypothetical protein
MSHLLLLGAGFTRNWGGWLADEVFEYLLGHPNVIDDPHLKEILWHHKGSGGFEYALAQVQLEYKQGTDRQAASRLARFQDALSQMFLDMDKGFRSLPGFEFQQGIANQLKTCLVKFDAIFTLNQDCLLETFYYDSDILTRSISNKRWTGRQIPGMDMSSKTPNPAEFRLYSHCQPYFKLHGSYDWRDRIGGKLLVMGGNKQETIESHDLLKWYHGEFVRSVSEPATYLMVIGYSFRDPHINDSLVQASNTGGLRIFIIDPLGVDVIDDDLKRSLNPILIGASRRPLRDIFGNDAIEHSKVMRFFSY